MPTDGLRILVAEPDDFPESALAALGERGDVVLGLDEGATLTSRFDRFDAVLTRLGYRIEGSDAPELIRCRVLGVPTTGLDHIDTAWCEEAGIAVVSLRGELEFLRSVRATAEHTLALMLAVLRKLVPAHLSATTGQWRRDDFRGREISGSVVGIVGVGRIGSMVAEAVAALGGRVLGYDVADDWFHPLVERVGSLEQLLERSDIVSIHVPYARGDMPLIGRDELGWLKSDAVLINTSRGGLVDEAALAEALARGEVGGAGLDVLQGEPDIGESPLLQVARKADNIVVTPHIGGNTIQSRARAEEFVVGRLLDALESQT